MDFAYDEVQKRVNITAYKETDICCKCAKVIRNHCPLLNCITNNYVYPAAEKLVMKSCSLYEYLHEEITREDIESELKAIEEGENNEGD